MISTNILYRVFYIRVGEKQGTSFVMEHSCKQYLVTARHVLQALSQEMDISIFWKRKWHKLSTTLVGVNDDADIAVLSSPKQLAPAYPAEPSMGGMLLAQQVFFLGFPLGLIGGGEELNRKFPLPLVKTGIVSGIDFTPPSKSFWIDGHNNPGFSGGPVVFIPYGEHISSNAEYKIAGVISGYWPSPQEVRDNSTGREIGYVGENSGIILAYSIQHAVDLIESNPIGCEIHSLCGEDSVVMIESS